MEYSEHPTPADSNAATVLTHPAQADQPRKEKSPRLWQFLTPLAAISAGLAVTATRVWELFYDEVKKTDGFRDRRSKFLAQRDDLAMEMGEPDKQALSASERFEYYSAKNKSLSEAYGKELLLKTYEDLGIRSDGIWGKIVGTWQRYEIIGRNNKVSAVIMGILSGGATLTSAMLLHENHRLWNKLGQLQSREEAPRAPVFAGLPSVLPEANEAPAATIQGPVALENRLVANEGMERSA